MGIILGESAWHENWEIYFMKFQKLAIRAICAAATVLAVVSLSSCGGGGSGTSASVSNPPPQLPSKILIWAEPSTFTDGTPLNPAVDLREFEIYIDQGGVFNSNSLPVAFVPAVEPGTGRLVSSFDLANLAPFVQKGVTYHVSLRSVGATGAKSDFAAPATFAF